VVLAFSHAAAESSNTPSIKPNELRFVIVIDQASPKDSWAARLPRASENARTLHSTTTSAGERAPRAATRPTIAGRSPRA